LAPKRSIILAWISKYTVRVSPGKGLVFVTRHYYVTARAFAERGWRTSCAFRRKAAYQMLIASMTGKIGYTTDPCKMPLLASKFRTRPA
jgi:hypothetical protein